MQRDPKAALLAIREAIDLARKVVKGRTLTEYTKDPILRAVGERQFITIGEALNRLSREAPKLAGKIPDVREAIATRHILVHGYDVVQDRAIWRELIATCLRSARLWGSCSTSDPPACCLLLLR